MNMKEQIIEELKHGNLSNSELIEIVTLIANDMLNSQTKVSYGRNKGKSSHAWKWAKGDRYIIQDVLFIVDN